jgi:DNA invertase Pin-like site-specific DNA recombinase
MFHIFSVLAQFERRLIQERTQAGLAAARARGKKGGRKPRHAEEPRVRMRYGNDSPENGPLVTLAKNPAQWKHRHY